MPDIKGQKKSESRIRRHSRLRAKVEGTPSRPRLCVFRSLSNIYAQVIDDEAGKTLVSASTIDEEIKKQLDGKTKVEAAKLVGKMVAERAKTAGVNMVVFDRGGYKYHGRVAALAEAAREAGLEF
ncbi:MAG: 50S ribosomal protein L18 [Phototrophicales bacterium]|nr:50S ribosomal protein L18 [Phototrophicales bacterium]